MGCRASLRQGNASAAAGPLGSSSISLQAGRGLNGAMLKWWQPAGPLTARRQSPLPGPADAHKTQLKAFLASSWLRWLRWSSASVNRRIFAASALIGALGTLATVAAFLKELVVARQFGRGDEIDAFLIAFLLPAFAINVVGSSLSASLVPAVVQVSTRQGAQAGARLFSSAVVSGAAMLVAVSVLLAAAFPLLLPAFASNFAPGKRALTLALFYALLPVVTINGIATIWSGMLNAGHRFAAAAAAPLLVPVVTVLFLLLFARAWGVYALVAGTVTGMLAQCGLLAMALRRRGLPIVPRWHGLDANLRQVIGQYLPMVAGAALMSSTALVDLAMAAMLDRGSVAALGYGGKLAAAAVGIGSQALGTAVLPHFSQMVANGDKRGLRHTLVTWSRVVLATAALATLLLVALSEPITRLLFERGAFTADDTRMVAPVQSMYLLQVPFYLAGILFVRVISALQRNTVLMCGAVISLAVNVVMNLVLMRYLGVAGIALSTSIVYLLSLIYLGWNARQCLK